MGFTYSNWLSLSLVTRTKIAQRYGIPKVRSTHVSNNVVVDDGYNIKDVERIINVVFLQKELNSTEADLGILFSQLVNKLDSPIAILSKEEVEQFNKEYTERTGKVAPVLDKPKRGRPAKNV